MGEIVSAVATADRCKFSTYGYACGKHVEHGRYLCEEHAKATCASCGQPATHGCDFCGQFVCGTPLCDECTFGTDDSKPSGAWGFMNHIHISRPEFADKHENRRIKEENDALARKAEALQRRAEEAEALAERLKREAQFHASEARTANSTIYEIYQVVSGGRGEPGNWHGAEPVRAKLEALQRENAELREALKPFALLADELSIDMSSRPNDRPAWGFNDAELTYGDFRRARALLGGSDAE